MLRIVLCHVDLYVIKNEIADSVTIMIRAFFHSIIFVSFGDLKFIKSLVIFFSVS